MTDWQTVFALGLGCLAVGILYGLYRLVKAIHFMVHNEFTKRLGE